MGFFCEMTALSCVSLASVWTINGLSNQGYAKSVSVLITFLISSNAFCSTSVHLNLTLLDVNLVNGASNSDLLRHISL